MWLSTMKYFSPSFSYMVVPPGTGDFLPGRLTVGGSGQRRRGPAAGTRGGAAWSAALVGDQVEADVLGRVLRVGEHDRPVVLVNHPAVVRRHVLLELGRVEVARFIAERLGDLVVVELERARAVDA